MRFALRSISAATVSCCSDGDLVEAALASKVFVLLMAQKAPHPLWCRRYLCRVRCGSEKPGLLVLSFLNDKD